MIFDALKPTLGKTVTSIIVALAVGLYTAVAGFTGGLLFGAMEAGIRAPVVVGEANIEAGGAAIDGKEHRIDVSPLEDAARKPVRMAVEAGTGSFFKAFLWIYGLWSVLQFLFLLRRK